MSALPPGRIPFEDIANAKSWVIPSVKGQPVNSVEQRKRKTKTLQNQVKQTQRVEPQQPVTSEDVETPEASNHRLTAQQLEEITLAAEQDGFSKGYDEGLERGKQDGRKTGYSDGLKAGTEQAESEHGQWLREQGEHLQHLCESLMAPLASQQQDLADAVLDLALGLTRHLLDAQLQLNPRHIVAVVDKALAALPPVEEGIELVLHPEDQDAFQEYSPKAGLIDKIKTDASLARGSCIVHSQHSFIDYSVATRLDEYMATLKAKPFDDASAELSVESMARDVSPESVDSVANTTDSANTTGSADTTDDSEPTDAVNSSIKDSDAASNHQTPSTSESVETINEDSDLAEPKDASTSLKGDVPRDDNALLNEEEKYEKSPAEPNSDAASALNAESVLETESTPESELEPELKSEFKAKPSSETSRSGQPDVEALTVPSAEETPAPTASRGQSEVDYRD